MKARGSLFVKNRKEMIGERQGARCEECGSLLDLELHHVVPVACGGSDEKSNLKVLCHRCHSRQPTHSDAIKNGQRNFDEISAVNCWINVFELYKRLEIACSRKDFDGSNSIFDAIEECKMYKNDRRRSEQAKRTIESLRDFCEKGDSR